MAQHLSARWLPWVSLAAFAALWIARWPGFPLALDPYYHLLIARQIVDAGGPLAVECWEYAPVGRPHLYPPILHLLLAALLKAGCAPIAALRLLSVGLPALLLLTIFLVMRRLASPATALMCLWAALIPFSFHLHSAVAMAATLGLVELLWLFDALERNRIAAAGVWLALLCYTHLGLPVVGLIALGCCAALRPDLRRRLARASWGLLLAAPWYWHLARHWMFLHPFPRQENTMVELMPALSLLALLGAWRSWKLGGPLAWLLGAWAGCAVLSFQYPYRWLSGEGALPVILLAGVGGAWVAQRLSASRRRQPSAVSMFGVLLLLGCSPTLIHASGGWQWRWPDSAPWHLLGFPGVAQKEIDASFSSPSLDALARQVAQASHPREILWSNAPYAIGLVAALAHRPISSAMLNEVRPAAPFDPIAAAHLIIWFKFADSGGMVSPAVLSRYPLARVAEDDLAIIFRNAGAPERARPPQAAMPWSVAMALLVGAMALIVYDHKRAGRREPTSV